MRKRKAIVVSYTVTVFGRRHERKDSLVKRAPARAFGTVVACVETYGATRPLDADSATVATRVWAMCHGVCSLELDRIGVFADTTDAFFAESIRAVVRGHHSEASGPG